MRASRDLDAGAASTVRVEDRGSMGEGEWLPLLFFRVPWGKENGPG
jgi:hypothetical protein